MPFLRTRNISTLKCQREWADWQQSPLALDLIRCEQQLVRPFLARKFGNYLLQIGIPQAEQLCENSPVANKTLLSFEFTGQPQPELSLVSNPDYLAVANDSIDALILHHVLEFSADPHQILREAQRVLTAGGQLFIIGFNPWSLWGFRALCTWHRRAPWSGRYFSQFRLTDWLRLLSFNHEETRYGYFKLPLGNSRLMQGSAALERWGQKYNCFFGSFYVMVARKQVAGMMPLRNRMRRRRIVPFPIAEPTTRTIKTSD